MRARWSTQTSTSGGSSDTELKALAVMPSNFTLVVHRDHGHAGGKTAERAAEFCLSDGHVQAGALMLPSVFGGDVQLPVPP